MSFGLFLKIASGFCASLLLSSIGFAADDLEANLKQELGKRFPGARIELTSPLSIAQHARGTVGRVQVLQENSRGEVQFAVQSPLGQTAIGNATFAAFVPTFVAHRRIRPGERLVPEAFSVQEVNVAVGLAREYRGVMLEKGAPLESMQARQTILEGQYPLSSGVEKIPDIRRGDTVRVTLTSGEIQLVTPAVAQEPGYLDGPIRVLTSKSKKELVGQVRAGGMVEVKL